MKGGRERGKDEGREVKRVMKKRKGWLAARVRWEKEEEMGGDGLREV